MTCTGFDAVAMDLCQKIEHCMSKYDKSFDEVVVRAKSFHMDWNDR